MHLMVFYARGKLDLSDQDGLLKKFYQHAPDGLRAHALWVAGRFFHDVETVPPEVLGRFQRLCESRVAVARASKSPEDFRLEMGAVGWLFASPHFDGAWALTQLRAALEISGRADPDHDVVERLASLAGKHPLTTVECLGMMADGDREGWRISYWGSLVRDILRYALRSEDAAAREYAVGLIHRLGSRGFLEYRDLLDN